MKIEEKLAEFLTEHKNNPENFNDGNYDPNPYWLAEDIVKLFLNHNCKSFKIEGKFFVCKDCGKKHKKL